MFSPASASNVEFGVAYRAGTSAGPGGVWGRVGVSDVPFLSGRFSAGVSNRAVELGYARGLSLAPLGNVNARSDVAVTFTGRYRLTSRASAALGPLALNLGGAYFTASLAEVDPLAEWALTATDVRNAGWNADITARYRVNRSLVAVLGGEFGPQHHAILGVEGRQDITRVVPGSGDDGEAENTENPEYTGDAVNAVEADPNAEPTENTEPETETLGSLAWRVGARAGVDVLAATAGVTVTSQDGVSLGLDALVGPKDFGVSGSLNAPELLGEGSYLRLYVAYEPWRLQAQPLRAGLEASVPAGRGELGLNVSGGLTSTGKMAYGAKMMYRLPLGKVDAAPEQP